jgi:hypothetical protein
MATLRPAPLAYRRRLGDEPCLGSLPACGVQRDTCVLLTCFLVSDVKRAGLTFIQMCKVCCIYGENQPLLYHYETTENFNKKNEAAVLPPLLPIVPPRHAAL